MRNFNHSFVFIILVITTFLISCSNESDQRSGKRRSQKEASRFALNPGTGEAPCDVYVPGKIGMVPGCAGENRLTISLFAYDTKQFNYISGAGNKWPAPAFFPVYEIVMNIPSKGNIKVATILGGITEYTRTGQAVDPTIRTFITGSSTEKDVKAADGSYVRFVQSSVYSSIGYGWVVSKIADAHGNTTQYQRDSAGNITAILYPDGRKTSFAYTGGKLTSFTAKDGVKTDVKYDELGRLYEVIGASGLIQRITYVANTHLIERLSWPTLAFTYLQNGLLASVTNYGLSKPDTTYFAYNGSSFSSVDRFRNGSTFYFDSQKRLVRQTTFAETSGSSGEVETLKQTWTTVNGLSRLSQVNDGSAVTNYTYQSNGMLKTVNNGVSSTTYTYEASNLPTQISTTYAGKTNTTSITYNSKQQVISTIDPVNSTSYQRNSIGDITQVTQNGKVLSTMTYNNRGQVTSVRNPLGHTVTHTYAANGDPINTTYPDGTVVNTQIDPATGRPVQLSKSNSNRDATSSISYDMAGRIASTSTQIMQLASGTGAASAKTMTNSNSFVVNNNNTYIATSVSSLNSGIQGSGSANSTTKSFQKSGGQSKSETNGQPCRECECSDGSCGE